MNCQQVRTNLSLYLYGELDFASEEALEAHLSECALCRRALADEKRWHTALNSERADVPLDFLSECRRELRTAISSSGGRHRPRESWMNWFGFSATAWSMRVAVASFLVVIGFSASRWMDRNNLPGLNLGEASRMGFLGTPSARIRDIQPGDHDQVRIVFDQIRTREITGRVDEDDVRQLLLAGMKDPSDPGIRVDSAEVLKGQNGSDVRQALIYSARHDNNAAVRLKALEALRGFASDPATRDTLKFALEHDDNPDVRSEAIDILAPAGQPVQFSPDLAGTLQEIARSDRGDDYVRMRCVQALAQMKASLDLY